MSEYPVRMLSFWPAVNTAVWRSSIAREKRLETSERRLSCCDGRFLNSLGQGGGSLGVGVLGAAGSAPGDMALFPASDV